MGTMFKALVLIGASQFLLTTVSSMYTCICWTGYKPEYNQTGAYCVANDQFHIMPCNMAMAPKCACSGGASSILKDRTGTWCTRYRKGEELMRWPCENTKEWDDFFRQHPDFI